MATHLSSNHVLERAVPAVGAKSCETKFLCSIFNRDVEMFLEIFKRLVFCWVCKTEETSFRYLLVGQYHCWILPTGLCVLLAGCLCLSRNYIQLHRREFG